jgi:hypothetical protein
MLTRRWRYNKDTEAEVIVFLLFLLYHELICACDRLVDSSAIWCFLSDRVIAVAHPPPSCPQSVQRAEAQVRARAEG